MAKAPAPAGGSELALLWNKALTAVSVCNIILWVALVARRRISPPAETKAVRSRSSACSWDGVWEARLGLAGVYVGVCALRAILPRHDGDRVCMWEHPLSTSLVGRSGACIAELAFAALTCAAFVRAVGGTTARAFASALFVANVVAQTCCNYAVLTRDQRGHVIEETIWGVSGAVLVAATALLPRTHASTSPAAATYRRALLLAGPVYVAFMTLVDVPMYIGRAQADAAAGTAFSTLADGLGEVSRCAVVTTADAYWRVEMPWMSLYFSVAVWAALWMAGARMEEPGGGDGGGSGAGAGGEGKDKEQ